MPPSFIKPTGPVAPPLHTPRPLSLPNGRAGQAYCLNLRELLPDLQLCLGLQQPAGVNFTLDTHTGQLAGTPAQAGEFSLELTFISAHSPLQQKCCLSLSVIQDPKSLWKTLPSNPAGLFARPDAECLQHTNNQHRLLAASKRGRSHAHVGSYRDDDFAICALESGWSLLVAADGAGSAQFSRRGAELICQTSEAYLAEQLQGPVSAALDASVLAFASAREAADSNAISLGQERLQQQLAALLGQAAYRSVAAIHAEAGQVAQAQVKDFSSTALIGLIRSYEFGTLCACYWVGDGAAALYREGAEVVVLGAADAGEYAGQTCFLDATAVTAEAINARTRFVLVEDFSALVLMTDGVSDPKFDTETNLQALPLWDALWAELNPLLQHPQAEQQLLDWLDFWSQGNHDDRTVILAIPANSIQKLQR